MKKIVVLVLALAVLIPVVVGAEEYFSPVEKGQICPAVAKNLPGAKVLYTNTPTGGGGILIGPLRSEEFLFIYTNARGEIFIYQPPAKYGTAAMRIIAAVHEAINNRPASDPSRLGRNLLE